jgi:peptide/nickel transport system permease protein
LINQTWKYRLRKNKTAVSALVFIGFLFLVALFADFLANDRPIVAKIDSKVSFPVFQSYQEMLGLKDIAIETNDRDYWKIQEYEWVVWPWVRFSPDYLDFYNSRFVAPGKDKRIWGEAWKHYLGTDELGRDVLSGLIHGCRVSLFVGIFAMLIASIIGITLGSLAGFWGDSRLKLSLMQIMMSILGTIVATFWSFISRSYLITQSFQSSTLVGFFELFKSFLLFVAIVFVFFRIGSLFAKKDSKKYFVPFDLIISRMMEIFVSIPVFILILALIAVVKPSIFTLILIIGCTAWVSIARFVRAELMRINSLNYTEAAKVLGLSNFKILWKHSLPNALTPVFITIAFGVAGAILLESTLSFLGIGVPAETVTWGKMLEMARKKSSAWWLAVFPGFMIFITVTALNLVGDGLSSAMDVKSK